MFGMDARRTSERSSERSSEEFSEGFTEKSRQIRAAGYPSECGERAPYAGVRRHFLAMFTVQTGRDPQSLVC